jgi:hypothetical protein
MRASIRFIVPGNIKSRENLSGRLERPGGMNIARTLFYVIPALHIHDSCSFLKPWLTVNIVWLSEGPNKTGKNRCMRIFILSEENKKGT